MQKPTDPWEPEVLTIATLERLRNSRAGNPRYLVSFTNGRVAQTAADSQVNYLIENREFRDVPLVVTFDSDGRIIRVKVKD